MAITTHSTAAGSFLQTTDPEDRMACGGKLRARVVVQLNHPSGGRAYASAPATNPALQALSSERPSVSAVVARTTHSTAANSLLQTTVSQDQMTHNRASEARVVVQLNRPSGAGGSRARGSITNPALQSLSHSGPRSSGREGSVGVPKQTRVRKSSKKNISEELLRVYNALPREERTYKRLMKETGLSHFVIFRFLSGQSDHPTIKNNPKIIEAAYNALPRKERTYKRLVKETGLSKSIIFRFLKGQSDHPTIKNNPKITEAAYNALPIGQRNSKKLEELTGLTLQTVRRNCKALGLSLDPVHPSGEDNQKLIKAAYNDLPIGQRNSKKLEELTGLSVYTIRRHCNTLELPLDPVPSQGEINRQRTKHAYNSLPEGERTYSKLQEITGFSIQTLYNHLKDMRLKLDSKRGKKRGRTKTYAKRQTEEATWLTELREIYNCLPPRKRTLKNMMRITGRTRGDTLEACRSLQLILYKE